ncbi:MAG: helix-turn-helix domain-containing protein [Planctomycetes bacterium]|nr:helix-turn-helix domain-containing protein [Planctomycetota bacterium]
MVERTPIVEGLLTYDQAGKLLGVTGRTVWTLVHRGGLPAVPFGHSVRIDPADLRAFIERSKQGPASDTAGNAGEGGSR